MTDLTIKNPPDVEGKGKKRIVDYGRWIFYWHHEAMPVWVRSDLKGKHREHCLCFECSKFHPQKPYELHTRNCAIANEVFTMCLRHELVLPVWECPSFKPNIVETVREEEKDTTDQTYQTPEKT